MHAEDDARSAAAAAQVALRGLAPLDIDRTRIYTDLVLQALGPAARHILETAMIPQNYVYQSDFARKYYAQGRVEAIYDVLEARGLAIPEELRAMLDDLRSPTRLQSLLRRALTVKRAEDLLPRPRRPKAWALGAQVGAGHRARPHPPLPRSAPCPRSDTSAEPMPPAAHAEIRPNWAFFWAI